MRAGDGKFRLGRTWSFLIRFVCPVAVLLILVNLVWGLIHT